MATTNALSAYAENEALDHMSAVGSWPLPAGTFLQLHTGAPGQNGTANVAAFTTRTEVAAWTTATGRALSNTSVLAITGFSVTETITHWSVHDVVTPGGGNCLFISDFTTNRGVGTGITLNIAAGDLDLDFLATNLCNYAANALLDHIVGSTAMTAPTNLFVQLHTGAPGDDATGNASTTTRVNIGALSAAVAGATDNDALIAITAGAAETVSHWSLHDASTAGNAFWQAALDDPRTVAVSEALEYAAGALSLSLN